MTPNKDKNINYVYAHIRVDTGEIFYIGIGCTINFSRAYDFNARNSFWKAIYKKTSIVVKILFSNVSRNKAIKKEISLIKLIGRRNTKQGTLVNLTDGGEGSINVIVKPETREKLRIAGELRRSTKATKEKLSNHWKKIGISSDKQSKMYAGRKAKGWKRASKKKLLCTNSGKIFTSIKEAAIYADIHKSCLGQILRGERKNRTSIVLLNT
jgi:hypothetical protein